MNAAVRICALVPTYDNPRTVRGVVERLRAHLADVLVVDDGSGPDGRAVCAQLARDGLASVHHQDRNRGKGAAMKRGFVLARQRGFTHALQVDADGQHDLDCVPTFVRAANAEPTALVLAYPVYDHTAPAVRLAARKFTRFWVDFEVGRKGLIRDALIGFRVYPLATTLQVGARGNHMEYEVEIAVRMARASVPIVNLPVGVRYLPKSEGGVSHFRPILDNLRLSWMHARICTAMSMRAVFGRLLPGRR
ncbi:MAG: glycosyltransferase family 2 protein [Planctomycetes bacterium]|nr:glycosyltransferase family 2 protein [Planctomycetota bacterium]